MQAVLEQVAFLVFRQGSLMLQEVPLVSDVDLLVHGRALRVVVVVECLLVHLVQIEGGQWFWRWWW